MYLSIGLRPAVLRGAAGGLTFLGAVAVAEALREMGLPAEVRWPNDVDVRGRKIAGILAESRVDGDRVAWAVLGIGINLRHEADDFPSDAAGHATSLRMESVAAPDEAELGGSLLESMEGWYRSLGASAAPLLDRWRELAPGHRGRVVIVEVGEGAFQGTTRGVDADGALLVECDDGRIAVVRAADLRRVHEA